MLLIILNGLLETNKVSLSIEHECSYDMLRDKGQPIEQHISRMRESVEEVFIKNETWLEIIGWLQILTPQERNLIIQHYLFDVQQVILAKINGKSKQAIIKILLKKPTCNNYKLAFIMSVDMLIY